jgi:hypothetical protein
MYTTHSFLPLLYVQLVSFSTAIIQHVYGHELQYILYIALPLTIPASTYLAPSSCDRNGPPQSQVARKLFPLSPIAPMYPSLPPTSIPSGFPGPPNVLLIRTHTNPFPSIRHINSMYMYIYFKRQYGKAGSSCLNLGLNILVEPYHYM